MKNCDISHTIYRTFGYTFPGQIGIGGVRMTTKQAIAKRILALCDERNIAVNALANLSGVAPSTVYSMLNEKSQNPGTVSLKKLCDGLGITLRAFFDCDLFDDLEQEIR